MLDHLIDPDDPSPAEIYAEKESESMSFEEMLEYLHINDEEYTAEELKANEHEWRQELYQQLHDDHRMGI